MLLEKEQIFLNTEFKNKNEALKFISEKAFRLNIAVDKETLYRELCEREREYPTAVRDGIAVPHSKSGNIVKTKLLFIKLKNAIEWESPDGFKINKLFVILVPENEASTNHLKILSEIAANLLEEDFVRDIDMLNDEKSLLEYFSRNIGNE